MSRNKKKEKALVCIHTAKSFADFIWYYSTYGENFEWDIVFDYKLPFESQLEYYKEAGVFQDYYIPQDVWRHKFMLFLKMVLAFILRQKKWLARSIIKKTIPDFEKYSLVVLFSDAQAIEGAWMILADQIKVDILEDGTGDYIDKKKKLVKITDNKLQNIFYFLLAKMGYLSIGMRYELNSAHNCNKFYSRPEKIKNSNYKKIFLLNDFSHTNLQLYQELLKRCFHLDVEKININNEKIILFTAPLGDFIDQKEQYVEKVVEYIELNFPHSSIFVKKHPRDGDEYLWDDNNRVNYIDEKIPGELVLNNCSFNKELYMFPSAILLNYAEGRPYEILFFEDLDKEQEKGKTKYSKNFWKTIEINDVDKNKIVKL